jgi:hypothetical protein
MRMHAHEIVHQQLYFVRRQQAAHDNEPLLVEVAHLLIGKT